MLRICSGPFARISKLHDGRCNEFAFEYQCALASVFNNGNVRHTFLLCQVQPLVVMLAAILDGYIGSCGSRFKSAMPATSMLIHLAFHADDLSKSHLPFVIAAPDPPDEAAFRAPLAPVPRPRRQPDQDPGAAKF